MLSGICLLDRVTFARRQGFLVVMNWFRIEYFRLFIVADCRCNFEVVCFVLVCVSAVCVLLLVGQVWAWLVLRKLCTGQA